MSTTFATNLGSKPQVCLAARNYVWPHTKDTWSRIGLQKPYLYLPANGNLVVEVLVQRQKETFRVAQTHAHAATWLRARIHRVEVPTLPRSIPVISTNRVGCGRLSRSISVSGSALSKSVQNGFRGSNRLPQDAM